MVRARDRQDTAGWVAQAFHACRGVAVRARDATVFPLVTVPVRWPLRIINGTLDGDA